MKQLVVLFMIAISIQVLGARNFWRGTFMDFDLIGQKWGKATFDLSKFKTGVADEKAKMTFDLIKNKQKYIGKSTIEIRDSFGRFSGHYFSEVYPTYIIQRYSDKKPETWQIVFMINVDRKVTDIVVHKNCCD